MLSLLYVLEIQQTMNLLVDYEKHEVLQANKALVDTIVVLVIDHIFNM